MGGNGTCKRLQALRWYGRALADGLQALPEVLRLSVSGHVPCPLSPLIAHVVPSPRGRLSAARWGHCCERKRNSGP